MKGHPTRRPVAPDDVAHWPAILTQTLYTRGEVERFLAKVDIRAPGECWPWTSAIVAARPNGRPGYGRMTRQSSRITVYAHRMSCELATGLPLGALEACHSCDFGPCANPAHIHGGTREQNVTEAVDRDRVAHGERSGTAVLTREQVVTARELRAADWTLPDIADALGVSTRNIQLVTSGRAWCRADGPITRGIRGRSRRMTSRNAAIRAERASGAKLKDIAARYGLDISTVSLIARGLRGGPVATEERAA